ncbi:hypothetical protein [uncultured Catenibacterium sp.]|uniref:hypothetical protein n=1 Tax=uncultured Catenibacterium sp. TaxID=286142 RepID=UPI0025FC8E23|nr:hypothetical protein [uncultured Catenibacterium sp.]
MNDEKRMVAGHVKDGRLAVYDIKGNLLCNASPEDQAFIMNVKHAFSGCDLIVGYEPQTLISFIVKHGITLQSYDFIDISSYTDFDFNKLHGTGSRPSIEDIAKLYGFPVNGNEAKDDALIILRTFLLLRERLEDSKATISEKDITSKEDRDIFFRIINWIDSEYCSRFTNLISRTEGSHSVSYMTINYDEIRTRISRWMKKECTYARVSYDEEYRLHIFTGIQSEDDMNSTETDMHYQHMTILPVPEHMNNMLHRKDISRKDIFGKAEKDWISHNLRKSIIEELHSYLKSPAEAEEMSYEDMFSSGMSDIAVAHRKGIRLITVIENRIKIQGSKNVSVIDGYITDGTEEPVYEEFITNDYYKRLNGTISPYKAKSTERAVRNKTGIHVDYISMMAVFYKILFNGHYMDVSC